MMSKNKKDEFYVLGFIDDWGKTQYIKSYNYKNLYINKYNTKGQTKWYKTYIYLTTSLTEAKTWKKRNGAFRMGKIVIAPTLNIDFSCMFIKDISIQVIRKEKILELGLLD